MTKSIKKLKENKIREKKSLFEDEQFIELAKVASVIGIVLLPSKLINR